MTVLEALEQAGFDPSPASLRKMTIPKDRVRRRGLLLPTCSMLHTWCGVWESSWKRSFVFVCVVGVAWECARECPESKAEDR